MRYYTIVFQLLWLSEGLPCVVCGKTLEATEGEDLTVACHFKWSGRTKVFCKNDCGDKRNILVKTTQNSAENGRYTITFNARTFTMTVRIKKVQPSDSGPYQCWLERTFLSDVWGFDAIEDIKISVAKTRVPAVTPPTTAVGPKHTPDPSPDPGLDPDPSPDPSLDPDPDASPDPDSDTTTIEPEPEQQSEAPQTGSLLYMGVTLAVILMLFSVALLIFYCKKKENNSKDFPVNAETGEVPEGDREYEEVPDQQVQSRPDCGSDIYSLASDPARTQVDPVQYAEVDIRGNSALYSQAAAEAVPYSEVQTQDSPLYSTISAPRQ